MIEEEEDKDETASNNNNEEQNQLEELFSAVAGATDSSNRKIADLFKLLPLRSVRTGQTENNVRPIAAEWNETGSECKKLFIYMLSLIS